MQKWSFAEFNITMSPTVVFNEGRQQLRGNVGYRVHEANVLGC